MQVDRCDDGITGAPTGVGQNYIWDRYPGEVVPDVPAHTLSVGLAGQKGVGGCCGTPSASPASPASQSSTGVGGCCGTTTWDPTTTGHHPSCDWEWGTCSCDLFLWAPQTGVLTSCPQPTNPGSTQIHLRAGVGPLGTLPTLPIAPLHPLPPTLTLPTAIPTLPISSGVISGPGPAVPITPAPTATPTIAQATTPPTPASTIPAVATAPVPASTNTGMLLLGLGARGVGLAGIAYLAHTRMTGGGTGP
jgi:hypothetical protein